MPEDLLRGLRIIPEIWFGGLRVQSRQFRFLNRQLKDAPGRLRCGLLTHVLAAVVLAY